MDAVLNWLWQGCVVAAAWFVLLRVLERARANVRYAVCWAALLLIITLPVWPSLRSAAQPVDGFIATPADVMVTLPAVWWTSTRLMLAVWMAWVGVFTMRFLSAMVALRRARSRSRAFPAHVGSLLPHWNRVRVHGRRATLVLSDSVPTAAVLGGRMPMIAVAPSLVETLDAAELDRVLIHEWAHVQRRDDLVNVLQIIVRAVAGWHPAVHWIERRLLVEREIACDEMTVAITGSPKSYAECLVRLASLKGAARAVQAAPAVLTASGLRARVRRIVSPHPWIAPAWSRTIAVSIVGTLCMMAAGVGGLQLVEGTAFALPFELTSSQLLSPTLHAVAPIVVPTLSTPFAHDASARQTNASAPVAQTPKAAEPSSVPPPEAQQDAPPASATVDVVETTPSAARDGDDGTVASAASAVVHIPEPPAAVTAGQQPQSPWTAVAGGGAALGRRSKDAGVATAGLFTRFARRVAGSF